MIAYEFLSNHMFQIGHDLHQLASSIIKRLMLLNLFTIIPYTFREKFIQIFNHSIPPSIITFHSSFSHY